MNSFVSTAIIVTNELYTNVTSDNETEYSVANQLLIIVNILIGSVGLEDNEFFIGLIVINGYSSMHKEIANKIVINQSIINVVSSLLVIVQMVSQSLPTPALVPNELAGEFYCRVWYTQLLL